MPPRHHPYSGYDAAAGQASGSGPKRGGPAGRGDRGRGGHHFAGPGHSTPQGPAGSPYGSSPPSSDSGPYPQLPQTSSAAPLRLGFGSPTRPGPPPPSSLPPAPGRPPIHLDGAFARPPIHLGGMRPPPPGPGTPSQSHQYQPPSLSQPPHYPSGPPPRPPPPHAPHQQYPHQGATSNDYGQRRSVSHDAYATSDYSNPYTQPQASGYPPNRPPPPTPPGGPPGASPYPAYPTQPNFNNVDAADREPSFGPDRSRGGPDRRAGADPYSRDGVMPRFPPALSGSQDQDPRTADEKPCRTLFIRSLDNSTSPESIRHHFLQFGEIKTFFDMIAKKGMCFVTFFDLRGAEWAKNTCHGQDFNGRRMDVHYSLPKNTDTSKRCDRDQNQGTLFMLLKRLARALSDEEFKTIFSGFGEVKSVRKYKEQKNARFLEFYDSRACIAAHDGMGGQQYTDPISGSAGEWDVKFAWDAQQIGKGNANAKGPAAALPPSAMAPPPPAPPSSAGGWSPPPAAPYQQSGPPPMRPPPSAMGYEARPPPAGPAPGPGQYQPSGPGSGSYGYNNAATAGRPPHATSPPQGPAQWGPARPPSAPPSAPSGPGGGGGGGGEDATSRLEQAQKVQQLLASLSSGGSGGGGGGGGTATNSAPPVATPSWQGGNAGGSSGGSAGAAGTAQNLPPNLAQLLAGVGGASGGQQPPAQQQQGADPRRSGVGPGAGAGGGAGNAGGGNSIAADAQESIQRMLAMLGQQQPSGGGGGAR